MNPLNYYWVSCYFSCSVVQQQCNGEISFNSQILFSPFSQPKGGWANRWRSTLFLCEFLFDSNLSRVSTFLLQKSFKWQKPPVWMCIQLYDGKCVYSSQNSDSNSLLDPLPEFRRHQSDAGVPTQTKHSERRSVEIQTIKREIEGRVFLLYLSTRCVIIGK